MARIITIDQMINHLRYLKLMYSKDTELGDDFAALYSAMEEIILAAANKSGLAKNHDEDPFESMSKNSAHSFTDGSEHAMKDGPQFDHLHKEMNDIMKEKLADAVNTTTVEDMSGEKLDNPLRGVEDMDYIHKRPSVDERFAEYTIDHQIEFMKRQISQPGEISAKTVFVDAIIHNLESIKRQNESPAYHGKVDVEKVIQDMVTPLRFAKNHYEGPEPLAFASTANIAIQNAEAALGMLQAFKGEGLGTMIETTRRVGKGRSTIRPLTQEDVEAAHQAGRGVMESYIPSSKRDELNLQIVRLINAGWNAGSIANAIIYAIEEMDRLRKV